jgi:pilus assembly protein CpaB
MNRRRVLGGSAAVVLAGLGSLGVISWASSTKNDAEAQQSQTAVVIVDKHVPKGSDAATIAAATHESTIQRKSLAAGALISEAEIGSQVAASDLYPGDQLVKDRLAAAVDNTIPADKVQISAQLTSERAVGGTIKTGDLVGVYLSFSPFDTNVPESDVTTPKKTPNTTHLEFQHVQVTNVQSTSEPVLDDTDSTDAKLTQVTAGQYIVTLALTPAQSERFVFATEFGHVWLSNMPATVTDDGTGIITLGSIYEVAS